MNIKRKMTRSLKYIKSQIGNKTYYTAEGTFGRKAMEDKTYFDNLLSTGQQINPDLGNNILNCTIKAHFLKVSSWEFDI